MWGARTKGMKNGQTAPNIPRPPGLPSGSSQSSLSIHLNCSKGFLGFLGFLGSLGFPGFLGFLAIHWPSCLPWLPRHLLFPRPHLGPSGVSLSKVRPRAARGSQEQPARLFESLGQGLCQGLGQGFGSTLLPRPVFGIIGRHGKVFQKALTGFLWTSQLLRRPLKRTLERFLERFLKAT